MTNIKDAHSILRKFSGDKEGDGVPRDAAIAISKDLINRLLLQQIDNINSMGVTFPSARRIKKCKQSFKASVHAANTKIELDHVNDPDGGLDYFPRIRIYNIVVKIEFLLSSPKELNVGPGRTPITVDHNPAEKIASVEINFSEISGKLVFIDNMLQFSKYDHKWDLQNLILYWNTDPNLKSLFPTIDESDWSELREIITVTPNFISDDISSTLVESINLPDILSIFKGVIFETDARLAAINEFICFSARSRLNFDQCAVSDPGTVGVESKVIRSSLSAEQLDDDPLLAKLEENIEVQATIPDGDHSRKYPPENSGDEGTEHSDRADVFLFTPVKLLSHNF
ncbi:hypothetical protein KHP62_16435 [Rhodobacteraceae bacterium NNCM2]|nr:hypothetical protein [Coraliihabitans acroporae]